MNGKSQDIREQQVGMLKELFPEAVCEGKIDFEKLKLTLGEDITIDNERYVLNWAGKSDAFRAIQTPTTATLKPQPEQSVNFENTENIFIEGENLDVLKVLQKSYYGKVKMICIDPPYNTGNDSFIYPDKFSESKEEYLRRIGDKDESGYLTKEGFFRKNSKENGQYHSNWLSMMYPRLFLARNLLRDDGVIFVSIDDNEVHNLRLMMNEIFGEENFVASIVWQKRTSPDARLRLGPAHDYLLVYCRAIEFSANAFMLLPLSEERREDYGNPDNDPRGVWASRDMTGQVGHATPTQFYEITTPAGIKYSPPEGRCWAISKSTVAKLISDNRIWFGKDGRARPRLKLFLSESKGTPSWTWWPNEDVGHNQEATKELNMLMGMGEIFDNPKPTRLIKRTLQLATFTENHEIVLDFFAGSGTTAQAVMEVNKGDGGNRKFILVQLPEKTDEDSEAYKAGYRTIADICKERIRRAIKNLTPTPSPNGEGDSAGSGAENLFKGASPTLFENAHRMRLVDKTEAEDRLWQALRNRQVEDCKFRRQHPIGKFIADFYCHEKRLVIEIDGGYHNEQEQKEHDAARTQMINEFGISVIRFSNDEVLKDMETTLEKISEALRGSPTDSPLSERRGAGGEAGFKAFTLQPSNFKVWRTDTIENGDDLVKQMDAFADPVRAGSDVEAMAWEILIKSGYELTTKLERVSLGTASVGNGRLAKSTNPPSADLRSGEPSDLSDGEEKVYSIAGGEVILALEKISQSAIDEVVKLKPKTFICLDRLFAGNDQLKTNTALQLKDAGVEFRTI